MNSFPIQIRTLFALALFISLSTKAASLPLTYNFDDDTLQGWTEVLSDSQERQLFALVPPSVTSPGVTPHSGSHFIGLHIPTFSLGPNTYTQDSPHDTLWIRSPEFMLNADQGDLTVWLSGGGAGSPNLEGTRVDEIPAASTTGGFRGIALRDVTAGTFVLSATKSSNGNGWEQVTFTESRLAALNQNAIYTLDLIDAGHGGWGWVSMDSVTIPGRGPGEDPPPPAPTISPITDRTIVENFNTGPLAFTVGHEEIEPDELTLLGTSSNRAIVPETNIVFGGSGGDRTVTVTPAADQRGSATITVTVDDGNRTTSTSFTLTVTRDTILMAFDFEDGTFSGWTEISTDGDGRQSFALVPPSINSPNTTPLSGSHFIGLHIHGFGDGNVQDSPHETLILRSPEFILNGSGDLTTWLAGGGSNSPGLADTKVDDLPAASVDGGFLGIALRDVTTETFVLSASKTSQGNEWQEIVFTASQLAALDQQTVYTLDLIDAGHGAWGWVNMDHVTIPGTSPFVPSGYGVVINEFTGNNRTFVADPDGDYEDWLELFNASGEDVNLAGYGLSDDPAQPFRWVLPSVVLKPGQHLLVWTSGKDRAFIPGDLRNGILREYYPNIPGGSVADLLAHPSYPDNPASRNVVTDYFDAPVNIADEYGQRMHGYLVAPQTGEYIFWIASDDNSNLYLNPGSEADVDYNAPIASVPGWTHWREWDKYPEAQQSDPMFLEEGQSYYIAALMKEGVGGDNLTVRWQLPDGTIEEPISAEHIYTYTDTIDLHTNFSISRHGEPLQIVDPEGNVVDATEPVALPRDVSYGRRTDGADEWVFFDQPTPAFSNNLSTGHIGVGVLDPPAFSHTSGFFTEDFLMTLAAAEPDAKIYYTLNGFIPNPQNADADAILYEEPAGIAITSGGVTVIRARAFNANYLPSAPVTQTYFVDPDATKRFSTAMISLVIEEPNLFDPDRGIYVNGNYWNRGIEWERPVHMTFFEPDGKIGFAQDAGVRIHGGVTRSFPQKSLRLYARGDLYGESHFNYQVHPDLPFNNYKRLLLRNSGNDNFNTMFRDGMMQSLVEHLRFDTQAYRPAVVYINSEYWGIQNIRDHYDEHYFSRSYGIDPESVDILQFTPGAPHSVKEGKDSHYKETLEYIQTNGLADSKHYEYIQTRIDVENFLDYNVSQIIINNADWPGNNHNFWRKQTDGYNPAAPYGHDGRWRWLMFDTDFGFHLYDHDSSFNLLAALLAPADEIPSGDWWRQPHATFLLRNFLENQGFRRHFVNRIADLLNTAFLPGRVVGVIDDMKAAIAPEMGFHYERWGQISDDRWNDQVTRMINFAHERPDHMRSHLKSQFNLSSNEVLLNVSDPAAGHLRVNATEISESTPGVGPSPYPWTGIYFNEIPIEVQAVAQPGYRFSHWKELAGSPEADSPVVSMNLNDNQSLTAIFAESEEPVLLHYWHFNELPAGTITHAIADHSISGNATITYNGTGEGYMDDTEGSELNLRLHEEPGKGLRVRNPSHDRALHLTLPTTGYENVQFSYAVRRTNNGAEEQMLQYSTTEDGNWSQLGDPLTINTDYQLLTFDFSAIPEAEDNPDFRIRVLFGGSSASGTFGNNRFDNVALEGIPLPETTPPPQLLEPLPQLKLSEKAGGTINLSRYFSSPDDTSLIFTAWSDKPGLLDLEVFGSELTLDPLYRGEATITISVDDGGNPPIETTFSVLIYPTPFPLTENAFVFDTWASDHPENTFPEHMLFLQSDVNDPNLETPLNHAYFIPVDDYRPEETSGFPYNNQYRTRLNGLGPDGISFINTGRGRDLGGALVALDTTGTDTAFVSWTGGTIEPNSRIYRIRFQYRTSPDQPFTDVLDQDSTPIEYARNSVAGHAESFGPIALPSTALGQPDLQLLWRYYHTGDRLDAVSGVRDELRLDNILVTTGQEEQQATQLSFTAVPPTAQSNSAAFPVIVTALTQTGVPTPNFEGTVTLSVESGPGNLDGTLSLTLEGGNAAFDDLVFSAPGSYILRIEGGDLDLAVSEPIQVTRITELVMPRYMQGDKNEFNDNHDRIPFAYRLKIEGLTPGATYRYGNRTVIPEDPLEQNGAGNMIFPTGTDTDWIRNTDSPRFQLADFGSRHHIFTTDENGVYTGWFVTEPTGNARFTPGNWVTLRILLNDGADGEETFHSLNTASKILITPFGSGVGEGSAIMGETSAASRHLVVLYDTDDGATRPVAAVPVEITGTEIDNRYAAFYQNTVANQDRKWGAIIPNNLPDGIRRIEEHSLEDGSILRVRRDPEGFPGTVNPTHGITPADLGGGISSYNQWRTEAFPETADFRGPDDDPNGHGITNLMRYAFAIPLDETKRERLPRIIQENDTNWLAFPYNSTATDLAYIIEGSPDLIDWTELLLDTSLTPIHPDSDGFFRYDVSPGNDLPRKFFRVRLLLDQ